MAVSLGPVSISVDFGAGVGVGLLVALILYLSKQVFPWEWRHFRERRTTASDLKEELWFYLDRVVRQWERCRTHEQVDPDDEVEALLDREAQADLETSIHQLRGFLEGSASVLDREVARDIDEACTDLRGVLAAIQQTPERARRAELEARGDEVSQRLRDRLSGL